MIECFVRIVAVVVNIFRLGPKRKLVDAPLTYEKTSEPSRHLRRGYLVRVECMRGKSSTICRLRCPTSQKRAYRAQKGVHRSAVLVFLENRSLIHGSRRGLAIPLVPYAQTCRSRVN